MIDLNAREYRVSLASDSKRVEASLDLPLDTVAGRRRLGRVVRKLERVWQDAEETAFLERQEAQKQVDDCVKWARNHISG